VWQLFQLLARALPICRRAYIYFSMIVKQLCYINEGVTHSHDDPIAARYVLMKSRFIVLNVQLNGRRTCQVTSRKVVSMVSICSCAHPSPLAIQSPAKPHAQRSIDRCRHPPMEVWSIAAARWWVLWATTPYLQSFLPLGSIWPNTSLLSPYIYPCFIICRCCFPLIGWG